MANHFSRFYLREFERRKQTLILGGKTVIKKADFNKQFKKNYSEAL
jgi:hypothetical protein